MTIKACSDEEFISLFRENGAYGTSRILKVGVREIFSRRRRIEKRIGEQISSPKRQNPNTYAEVQDFPGRATTELKDGQILLGTDSHYWPGVVTDAHKAFVKLAAEIKPAIIIKNGDELDFPSISRWPGSWEKRPSVFEELEWASERLEEIRQASKSSKFFYPIGNHDYRFELRLAQVAQEFKNVQGVHLKDHIPGWTACWSLWINGDVVVKHRFKTGITAARQNTMLAGKHIFTGHTHRLVHYYFADYNGMRYGMECGTMANPYGEQFLYVEDNPREWVMSFVLLTFSKGKLMPPEAVICPGDGTYEFRGRSYQL